MSPSSRTSSRRITFYYPLAPTADNQFPGDSEHGFDVAEEDFETVKSILVDELEAVEESDGRFRLESLEHYFQILEKVADLVV